MTNPAGMIFTIRRTMNWTREYGFAQFLRFVVENSWQESHWRRFGVSSLISVRNMD